MSEQILSAGLDIGTTTTQLILSRLTLKKQGGFGAVPSVEVTEREIVYRSPVVFTQLDEEDRIDGEAAERFLSEQYACAGVRAEDIDTGAVIVTGETAKKRNARAVIDALSLTAGDFVVSAAGAAFESTLAGRGAGADLASLRCGCPVLNIDIGGGTSNLCLFDGSEEAGSACAAIGGRLIRVDPATRTIVRIAPAAERILCDMGLQLSRGDPYDEGILEDAAEKMADLLAQICGFEPMTPLAESLLVGSGLDTAVTPGAVCFSGGVADCMETDGDPFRYGDIGPLLGQAVRAHPAFRRQKILQGNETVRATVIGAGSYSVQISGSTIACDDITFPIKSLPVYPVTYTGSGDLPFLVPRLEEQARLSSEADIPGGALFLEGPKCPGFREIERLADILADYAGSRRDGKPFEVILVEHDFAKALGQAIRRRLRETPVLCLDGIRCRTGDYIDIGAPLGGGICVPVVVKTLLFQKEDTYESA